MASSAASQSAHHPKGKVVGLGLVSLDNTVVAILLPGTVFHGQRDVGVSVMLKLRTWFPSALNG